MTGKLFVPAPFVGLFADMPPASAPPSVREGWLERTRAALIQALPTAHGLQALRLVGVIHHEYRELAARGGER